MLNVAVLIKLALDAGQLSTDPTSGILTLDDTPLKISDIDRNALEEAVRVKEQSGGKIGIVSLLTWGPVERRLPEAEMLLREALAVGADEACLIVDERLLQTDSYTVAKAIAAAISQFGPFDLVLAGEGSMDNFSGQTGPRVGEELKMPIITYVRKLQVKDKIVTAERDLEDYREIVETTLPATVTVTKEINVPRLPTLLQIRLAVKKPLKKLTGKELETGLKPKTTTFSLEGVKVERRNIKIKGGTPDETAEKFARRLREEGLIGS